MTNETARDASVDALLSFADGMVMHHDTSDLERYRDLLRDALIEAMARRAQRELRWQTFDAWWLDHGRFNAASDPAREGRIRELMKLAFEVGREGDAAPPPTLAKTIPKASAALAAPEPPTYRPSRDDVQAALVDVDRIRDSYKGWGGWSGIEDACARITKLLRYGTDWAAKYDGRASS